MNNEHYLIHKDDYIKHIDEKVLLYMMVQQLTFQINKLAPTKKNEALRSVANRYHEMIDAMFQTWGIPGSYLVFSKESDLAELMENELIAPEDAGYIPAEEDYDDECCCDCCGCPGCPYADSENDEAVEDEADDGDEFIEMIAAMSSAIHKIFGDKVSIHIVVED